MAEPAEYRIGEWYRIERVFLEQEQGLVGQVGYCVGCNSAGFPILQLPGRAELFACAFNVNALASDHITLVSDIPDE